MYRASATGDSLVRTFLGESVSYTYHKNEYIGIRGTTLSELQLSVGGRDEVIADFLTEYTTLNGGKGIVFTGAPPICSDGDKYIFLYGSESEGEGDETNVIWRIQISDLELPSLSDFTWARFQNIDQDLPTAITGTGGTGKAYSLTGAIPSGITFDPAERKLSGTVSATARTGRYAMTYTVTDADGAADSQTFTITVTADPVLSTPTLGPYSVGIEVPITRCRLYSLRLAM